MWEYKVEQDCNEKKLNALGAEGWELVTVATWGPIQKFYFKRRKA